MADAPERSPFVRLYLDEDVFRSVAVALRARGFDAISAHELQHYGWSDAEQLAYAAAQGRALFSFNVADYVALHREHVASGQPHAGIVVSKQRPLRDTILRLLALLNRVTPDAMRNQLWWI